MPVKFAGDGLTPFALDSGDGLSEHAARFGALAIGVEGAAEISLGGVVHRVAEGQTLLMPANVPHTVSPVDRFKVLLVMIRGEKPA